MSELTKTIKTVIMNTLGVEEEDVTSQAHFQLDLNATMDEMEEIKTELEERLDISLPDFTEESPATVEELEALVYDSTL